MSKKYIALIIVLLLLPAFLMTGCSPAPGGGNNGVVPIIVIFDAQGGAVSPASKEVTAGSAYGTLPLPTKPDSTFIGWFTEKAGGTEVTSSTKVTKTKSHTLYAQWSGPITTKKVTVTFDPEEGTVSPASKEVTVGSPYGELPVPTKPDSTFLGWFTEKIGGTEVTSSTTVNNTKSHTLYAHWAFVVTVTFDPQGGVVSPASKEVTVGSTYGTLPTPSPPSSSLIFIGWFTEKVGDNDDNKVTEDDIVTIDHNHTLYAQWIHFVMVTFDPQGGTVSPKNKLVGIGHLYGFLPTPEHPLWYKRFIGWFTGPDMGIRVTSSTIVTIDHNHTLYAHWKNIGSFF